MATSSFNWRSLPTVPRSPRPAIKGVIRLWDPATGQELLSLAAHRAQINGLAFSPDGSILGSVAHDGSVRLWRLSRELWPGGHVPDRLTPRLVASAAQLTPPSLIRVSSSAIGHGSGLRGVPARTVCRLAICALIGPMSCSKLLTALRISSRRISDRA